MDRRTLLTSIAGAAAVTACSARDDSGAGRTGRPTLVVDSEGHGKWRVRSWQWRGGAWQPRIAWMKQTGAGIEWSGQIGAADKARAMAIRASLRQYPDG